MKPINIYMHPLSPPSNAIRLYCQFLATLSPEIEIKEQVIDLPANEHKQAWYTTINPAGQVPAIEIQGKKAFGHSALKLIAYNFDPMYPSDQQTALDYDMMLEQIYDRYNAGTGLIMLDAIDRKLGIFGYDQELAPLSVSGLERAYASVESSLKHFELHFNSGQTYIMGTSQPTIVDFSLVARILDLLEPLGVSLEEYPSLKQYYVHMQDQPYYKSVHSSLTTSLTTLTPLKITSLEKLKEERMDVPRPSPTSTPGFFK